MKAIVKTTIGKVEYTFELEEQSELDTLHKAAALANPPDFCDECENSPEQDGFKLVSNKDKENNIYVNVLCNRCCAKAKLGLYKSGGYFWKKFEDWKKQN